MSLCTAEWKDELPLTSEMQEVPFSAGPPASLAKKLGKRVQLVSGTGDQGVSDKCKTHHPNHTFHWIQSNTCPVLPQVLLKIGNAAHATPRPLHLLGITGERWQGRVWVGWSLLVARGIGGHHQRPAGNSREEHICFLKCRHVTLGDDGMGSTRMAKKRTGHQWC